MNYPSFGWPKLELVEYLGGSPFDNRRKAFVNKLTKEQKNDIWNQTQAKLKEWGAFYGSSPKPIIEHNKTGYYFTTAIRSSYTSRLMRYIDFEKGMVTVCNMTSMGKTWQATDYIFFNTYPLKKVNNSEIFNIYMPQIELPSTFINWVGENPLLRSKD